MTQATRNGLIGILDAPQIAEIDQAVMSAYLAPYSSHADYVERATGETVYFAVQATAEYHEHWQRHLRMPVLPNRTHAGDTGTQAGSGRQSPRGARSAEFRGGNQAQAVGVK